MVRLLGQGIRAGRIRGRHFFVAQIVNDLEGGLRALQLIVVIIIN